MKPPLLPALTLILTLTCVPALAQLAPSPVVEVRLPEATSGGGVPTRSSPATPTLRNPVALKASTVGDVIDYLNTMLGEQKAPPLNVVVMPEVENVKVPAMTLHNVTASDVLNVVTKVAGLSLEPVAADSGGTAAWIITRRIAGSMMGSGGFGIFGGSEGGPVAGGGLGIPALEGVQEQAGLPIPGGELAINNKSTPPRGVSGLAGSGNPALALPGATGIAGMPGMPQWLDPASAAPAPAQVSRVIGIGRIYEFISNQDERSRKEAELADMLSKVADDQHLECKVQLYQGLRVIVLKGTSEAVALVEQTVAAMKENAGTGKSTASGPRTF